MLPAGHYQQISQPRTLGSREKWILGSVLGLVAVIAIAVVVAFTSVQKQSRNGCIDVSAATVIGGSELYRCGQAARDLCDAPGPPSDQNENALQLRAIDRLKTWGIGAGEIGPVWQRRMMGTAEDNSVLGAPTRLAYKTFVLRSVLGVRVDGHRAVVTHGLDGSFRRAIAVWPALAASGHLLHTQQTIAQIKARAAAALAAEGFTTGKISLRWKYVATAAQSGEVTLKLMVGARTAGVASNELGEEPYEVNVDVNAIK